MPQSELKQLANNLKSKAKADKAETNDLVQALAIAIEKIDQLLVSAERISALEAEVTDTNGNVAVLNDQMQNLSNKFKKMEKKMADEQSKLEHMQRNDEYERSKLNVLVAGVRMNKKAKNGENYIQTAELTNDIMKAIGLEHMDIVPLRFKKTGIQGKPPLIRFTFRSMNDKHKFYTQLAKKKPTSKNEFVKSLHCRDECPSFLRDEYQKAQKQGYEIRKNEPGSKIRIMIRKNEILVLKKAPGADKYNKVLLEEDDD